MSDAPQHLDLQRDRALVVTWADGTVHELPIAYLRRMSPSAEQRELRTQMETNPLAILPTAMASHEGPITAVDAELVGHYAIRIHFSDGHDTGIFSWSYLRRLAEDAPPPGSAPADAPSSP